MFKIVTIRFKGGSSKYEDRQMEILDQQEALDAQLEQVDTEYYKLKQSNKAQYDEDFRPLEEGLLKRAALPAREATSAGARASEYDAADTASDEAQARRNARYGISNSSSGANTDDDFIRAIALTAVGNASKMSALETQGGLQETALGIGTGVNQDIAANYSGALQGMGQSLGHADAAFSNFSNAQQHENNAYLARQQGTGALIKAGVGVAGIGISNYQNASYTSALSGDGTEANWKSSFSGNSYAPTA